MGYEVDVAPSAEEGLCLAAANRPDLMILDVRLPGMDGLTAMESFRRQIGKAPIIVITAFGDLPTAVDAINKGAFEYVVKPFDVAEIRAVMDRALRAEPSKPVNPSRAGVEGMLGRTPAMQNVFKKIALAANSDAAVLLEGESGVGKELAALAIHRNSARRGGPFVMVNVGSLEPARAEAELFGTVDESGANRADARAGLLLQAHGGTLFIDEVADMPMPLQLKLLRVLTSGEVQPVGSGACAAFAVSRDLGNAARFAEEGRGGRISPRSLFSPVYVRHRAAAAARAARRHCAARPTLCRASGGTNRDVCRGDAGRTGRPAVVRQRA